MRVTGSIGDRVATYLEGLPLLSVIDRDNLLIVLGAKTESEARSIFAALDYYMANTGVSMRGKGRGRPKLYYALRIELEYAKGLPLATTYLSLPGIPRELLKPITTKTYVGTIIQRLEAKYGKVTINYWGRSAQKRSVDIGGPGMRKAKLKNPTCPLCAHADQLCQKTNSPSHWNVKQKITACHIVARKTIFWTILDEVDKEKRNIFTDDATTEFLSRMKANKWHSDSQYIGGLCDKHDRLIRVTLELASV